MIHPRTELRFLSDEIGYGVFATAPLPRGTLIWTLCRLDRRYTREEVAALPPVYRDIVKKYRYVDARGDSVLCWDHARYINHSCDPTNVTVSPWAEILLRDVAAGEQITGDYGTDNLERDLACRCGAARCRGVVGVADMARHAEAWDRAAREALPCAAQVPQALRPFLEDAASFDAMTSDPSRMPSLRELLVTSAP